MQLSVVPRSRGQFYVIIMKIVYLPNVIVFYFVFSAVFIGEGLNLTIYFTFWFYVY